MFLHYEHRTEPVASRATFARRMLWHVVAAALLLAGALLLGVVGYHATEQLSWIDSLLNASMILGGMGPVAALQTDAGKVFASAYALFSGVAFLVVAGILVAPAAHRLLHWLHVESPSDTDGETSRADG